MESPKPVRSTFFAGRARGRFRNVGRVSSVAVITLILARCGVADPAPQWRLAPLLEPQVSGTDALLIGLSIVDTAVVWASGANGRWVRSIDGGETWTGGTVPGADTLQFRDVHAIDADHAYLLSIGPGEQSRICRTDDAGASWTMQYRATDPRAFLDCFDFWDSDHGIAFGDSFDGRFLILVTSDGGTNWTEIPPDRLPPADSGEGSFAASGTCLVVAGDSAAFVGTGASDGAGRVLRTRDGGRSWKAVQTPIVRGASAGIASLAFRDARNGAALGGDVADASSRTDNVIVTRNGGETWQLAASPPFNGAVYGAAWIPDAPTPTLVAVGPNGLAFTVDEGRTWTPLDTLNHWSVSFASPDRGWAVGPGGRVTRIRLFAREER